MLCNGRVFEIQLCRTRLTALCGHGAFLFCAGCCCCCCLFCTCSCSCCCCCCVLHIDRVISGYGDWGTHVLAQVTQALLCCSNIPRLNDGISIGVVVWNAVKVTWPCIGLAADLLAIVVFTSSGTHSLPDGKVLHSAGVVCAIPNEVSQFVRIFPWVSRAYPWSACSSGSCQVLKF